MYPRSRVKQILYLSYDGLTDPLGQSQILPYLGRLSAMGETEITVISFEKKERYKKHRTEIFDLCNRHNIFWLPLNYSKRPPVLSTLFDIWKMRRLARRHQLRRNFDLVHCRSYIPALVGAFMKRRYKSKFLFDMRGFWADERVEGYIWNLRNPVFRLIYRFFKNRERELLQAADAVVSLTHAGKEAISSGALFLDKRPLAKVADKIHIIPCAADLELFDPEQIGRNKQKWLRAKYGIEQEVPVIGYVGSLGTWYLSDALAELFSLIGQRYLDVHFLLISQDSPRRVQEIFAGRGLPLYRLLHISAARKEVPQYLSILDAAVFFIRPVFSKKASSPTKQGELMAMGIPVICNANVGDSAEIVQRFNSGLVLKDTSRAELERAVEAWPGLRTLDRSAIRQGAKAYFNLQDGVLAYRQIYRQLLDKTLFREG